MYQVQLNCYGLIAPRIGLGSVYGLGLLNYELITDITDEDFDSLIQADCFFLKFSPKLQPVLLEPNIIPPLLRRVREICDLSESPIGRPGCRDCCILETLIIGAQGASSYLEKDLIGSLKPSQGMRVRTRFDGALLLKTIKEGFEVIGSRVEASDPEARCPLGHSRVRGAFAIHGRSGAQVALLRALGDEVRPACPFVELVPEWAGRSNVTVLVALLDSRGVSFCG